MRSAMRILQVTLAFYPAVNLGGPIKIVHENSRELMRRGHEVVVFCTNRLDKQNKMPNGTMERVVGGIRVVYFDTYLVPKWPGTFGPFMCRGLVQYLRSDVASFDIIHVNGCRDFLSLTTSYYAQKMGVPYVIQPHGTLPYGLNSVGWKRTYDLLFKRYVLNNAACLVVGNPSEAQQGRDIGFPDSRVVNLPNGIDPSVFADLPPCGQLRDALGIPKDQKIILFLGRINKKKGLDILVRSYAHIRTPAVLVIVGADDDGHRAEVQKIVNELGLGNRVFFTGSKSGKSVLEAYVDADLFALTCRTDTFPMAVVEACATGTPILVTNTCEIAYLIEGRAGLSVPLDETAIASGIDTILQSAELQSRFSAGGRQLALNEFSIKAVGDMLESIYQRVIVTQASSSNCEN